MARGGGPGLAGDPSHQTHSATSDASVIAGGAYVAQVLNFAAGLVQKAILGPAGTGFWALMQSFWELSKAVQLGAFTGAGRQIPLHRGQEDFEAAAAASDTGVTFSLVAMAALGSCAAAFAVAFGGGWAPEMRWGVVILGLTSPLRLLTDAHEVLLQATRRFRPVSLATIVKAVLALTVQTALVALLGFYGMFAGTVLAAVAALALYWRMGLTGFERPAFHWRIDRGRLKELIAYGLPILVFGEIWLLFMGIDNLIIAGFIDVESLGYYALAVSVTSYILYMPRSIGQALFPRMAERFGQTGDVTSLARYATEAQQLLAFILVPVFVGGAFFALPVLIHHALPEFDPAVEVVHIMVAGSFFIALCNLPIKAMTTAGKRLALILLVALCLGFNAGANYLAVAVLEEGIEGAAVATVISYGVVFLLTSGYALAMMLGTRRMVAHVGELLVVVGYVCGVLWGIEALLGGQERALVPEALVAGAKLALFVAAMAPWLVVAERRLGGLTRLRQVAAQVAGSLRSRGRRPSSG